MRTCFPYVDASSEVFPTGALLQSTSMIADTVTALWCFESHSVWDAVSDPYNNNNLQVCQPMLCTY